MLNVLFVPSFLCSLKLLLFHLIGNTKEVSTKHIEHYDPISVLYEFQIDISANSREIKYRNMGIGLLHVKRHTRQK